ncbi:MAG TPA: hypothetical protein VIW03_17480, partial [Anaeromyxobacter sp.]
MPSPPVPAEALVYESTGALALLNSWYGWTRTRADGSRANQRGAAAQARSTAARAAATISSDEPYSQAGSLRSFASTPEASRLPKLRSAMAVIFPRTRAISARPISWISLA